MTRQISCWINGKAVKGSAADPTPIVNPATGEAEAEVRYASESDVDQALEAAIEAFPSWSEMATAKRAAVMFQFGQLVRREMFTLASIITAEHGKTIDDAKGEIQRGLDNIDYACGVPNLLKGDISLQTGTDIDVVSIRQPLGVCVGITPFNFPAMVPLWMMPLAVACGNTVIIKPSEKVPTAATFLAELASEAGLPDGVFNVVHGGEPVATKLITDARTAAVSFVGSTPVAKSIYQTGTSAGKRVQALGGAKNHLVVMPDANLDETADALVSAGYGSAGQRCMAVSVAVAVGGIGDPLIEKLKEKTGKINVGPGADSDSDMGPLITPEQKERVEGYIQSGIDEGADLVVDGRGLSLQGFEKGNFVGPTLFDKVSREMKIYKEEIFGPVLSVVRAGDYDEAADLVNTHPYANGTAVFTNDGNVARHFMKNIQVGMVGINVPIPVPVAQHSFGGWRNSLFGDYAIYGDEGVRFYTCAKTITSRWSSAGMAKPGPNFVMPVTE